MATLDFQLGFFAGIVICAIFYFVWKQYQDATRTRKARNQPQKVSHSTSDSPAEVVAKAFIAMFKRALWMLVMVVVFVAALSIVFPDLARGILAFVADVVGWFMLNFT